MTPSHRGCPLGKRPHSTRGQAKRWLRSHGYRGTVYICPHCEMFHATTIGAARRAVIREYRKDSR